MIDFSLIMPVRNNMAGLKVALGAFQLFTAKPDAFEIHLLVDDNDTDRPIYDDLIKQYSLNITIHSVKPTDNFSNDYYNYALQFCKGTNIMVWNDDCYMQTNAWDNIVRKKITGYTGHNGIYMIDMWDSTRLHMGSGHAFARFPMISRKAVDTVGFFFFPTVRNWPADKVIWDLYAYIKRIIPCHEVKIQHDHNFDHENDPSKSRFMRILNEDKKNGVFPVNALDAIAKLEAEMKKMKDFSIVIPVRGNIKGLRVTLGAFELFTAQKDKLEVILIADNDDPDLIKYNIIGRDYTYDIMAYGVPRTDNFCESYYNFGARKAVGTNIMVFNDDCYVQTNEWDDIVRRRIAENPQFNGVYLVSLMDSTYYDEKDLEFPRFPMISKKAVETIGFFFFPQVRMWPADKCIHDLYKAVGCVITCHKVKLQHDHIYDDKDASKSRMGRIMEEDIKNGVFPVNGNEQARQLLRAINEKH